MILSAHCQPDKPENPSRIASYFRLQEAKQKAETLASFFRSLRMTNVRMYARSKFFCVRQFLILILSTHLCQHKLSFFDLAFDISVVFNNLKGIFGDPNSPANIELARLGIRADAVGDHDVWQNRTYTFSLVDMSGLPEDATDEEILAHVYKEDAEILEDANGKKIDEEDFGLANDGAGVFEGNVKEITWMENQVKIIMGESDTTKQFTYILSYTE